MKPNRKPNSLHSNGTSSFAEPLHLTPFLSNELSLLYILFSCLSSIRPKAALFSNLTYLKRPYIFKNKGFTKFQLVHGSFSPMRLLALKIQVQLPLSLIKLC